MLSNRSCFADLVGAETSACCSEISAVATCREQMNCPRRSCRIRPRSRCFYCEPSGTVDDAASSLPKCLFGFPRRSLRYLMRRPGGHRWCPGTDISSISENNHWRNGNHRCHGGHFSFGLRWACWGSSRKIHLLFRVDPAIRGRGRRTHLSRRAPISRSEPTSRTQQ